jgi:MFS family permease
LPLPAGSRPLTAGELWHSFAGATTGRLLLFAVVMQAGVYASGPYFNPYMLKVLDFSYVEYATLLGISFVAKFLMLPLWGRVAQRWGAMRLLWIGTIGVIPLAGGWNVSSDYWYLLGLQVVAGTAWGAYELALVLLFFETIPERERTSILTWYNLANSVALVCGSALGALVLHLGEVSPEAYHWVYALSTLLRGVSVLLLLRLPRMDVAAAEAPLRPLSVSATQGSLDSPVLPGLPDQSHPRIVLPREFYEASSRAKSA